MLYCQQCKCLVDLSVGVDDRMKNDVSSILRGEGVTGVILYLKKNDLSLTQAKGIALHVSKVKGHCHRCNRTLNGDAETTCDNCHALNLDW